MIEILGAFLTVVLVGSLLYAIMKDQSSGEEDRRRRAAPESDELLKLEYDHDEALRMFSSMVTGIPSEDKGPRFDERGNSLNCLEVYDEEEESLDIRVHKLVSELVQSLLDDGMEIDQIRKKYPKLLPPKRPWIYYEMKTR